jgi:4-hydroxy-3-methylbut-2-en-1-yl diphosphate reductase
MKPKRSPPSSGAKRPSPISRHASRRCPRPASPPKPTSTTSLASESLEIADLLRAAMTDRWGEEEVPFRFRSFDTICSATQERQDAVHELLAEHPDLMLVVGGYNSSNTGHLAEIASEVCPAFHIDRPDCLISPDRIHHLPPFQKQEIETKDWLPAGPITIGLTAGASTPNRVLGDCIERIIKIGTPIQR